MAVLVTAKMREAEMEVNMGCDVFVAVTTKGCWMRYKKLFDSHMEQPFFQTGVNCREFFFPGPKLTTKKKEKVAKS